MDRMIDSARLLSSINEPVTWNLAGRRRANSRVATRERRVRDAVLEGRVSWKEFRVGGG